MLQVTGKANSRLDLDRAVTLQLCRRRGALCGVRACVACKRGSRSTGDQTLLAKAVYKAEELWVRPSQATAERMLRDAGGCSPRQAVVVQRGTHASYRHSADAFDESPRPNAEQCLSTAICHEDNAGPVCSKRGRQCTIQIHRLIHASLRSGRRVSREEWNRGADCVP